jgi:DNA methyltransferase 1-associated protein 1
MNETEFALYETLSKYNPTVEERRKELGWGLFKRPLEEIREEEYLLAELQRIMISAQKFEAERAEVRQRLDHPNARKETVPSSFTELNTLYNQLFAQDRNRRARGRLSINANDLAQTPSAGLTNGTPASASHRDSIASTSQQKKANASTPHPVRTLDARAENKFGITSHDRLTSGVTFRSDKLLKMRQAKSQIQTQKITQALIELGVPDLLQLPTQRVMDTFEALIQRVQKLVDARKLVEKEEAEARVQGGLRKELQKDDPNDEGDAEPKTEDEPTQIEEEEEEEEEEEDEEEVKDEEEDEERDADGDDDDDAEGEEEDEFEGNENEEEDEESGDAEGEDDDADAEAEADVDADGDGDGDADEMEVD